jgi:transposase
VEGEDRAFGGNRASHGADLRSRPRRVLDRAIPAGTVSRCRSCTRRAARWNDGGGRAKTDRIDLDMLLRTLLAWLRGEPRVCSMVRIPSEAEEDMRRPERTRAAGERADRVGEPHREPAVPATGFKPRLKKTAERPDELGSVAGTPLPPRLLEEVKRLMTRHRVLSEQLSEIEAARERTAMAAEPDHAVQQTQMLTRLIGLGLATATRLTREVFCRSFADRRAIAGFVGLTGTPFNSGGSEREQGISKNGNPRVRRILLQLAWRWLPLSAGQRIELLVLRAHRRGQGTHPQDHGGGTRPQVAGGLVALRRVRRIAGRCAPRRCMRADGNRNTRRKHGSRNSRRTST